MASRARAIQPAARRGNPRLSARLEQWIPGLRLIRGYERGWLRPDLVAGVVLAAILVPQGMAYA